MKNFTIVLAFSEQKDAFFSTFSSFSANPVNVSLKITVSKELGKDILFKDRYRAGIKAEFFFKWLNQALRKDHVADTHRGRQGSGEGIQIYDPSLLIH